MMMSLKPKIMIIKPRIKLNQNTYIRFATSQPHKFLGDHSKPFRPRSCQANNEVIRGQLVSLDDIPNGQVMFQYA